MGTVAIRVSIRIYLDNACMKECMTSQVFDLHAKTLLSLQAEMSHLKTVLDGALSADVIDRATNAIWAAQTVLAESSQITSICTAHAGPCGINAENHHLSTTFAMCVAMYVLLSMCFATYEAFCSGQAFPVCLWKQVAGLPCKFAGGLWTFVVVVYRCLPSGLREIVEDVYRCIPVISPIAWLVALCIVHTGGVVHA